MEKKYLVFAYDQYYPGGGWSDLKDRFATLEEAQNYIKTSKEHFDFWEIINAETGEDQPVK
jgi:hypothetical protein